MQINFSISPTGWINGAFLLVLPNNIPTIVNIPGVAVQDNGVPINEQTFICKAPSGDLINRTLIGYKSTNTGYFVCTFTIAYDN